MIINVQKEIKKISKGSELEIMDGPVLYSGFVRYKVREVLTNGISGQTGWVALNWIKGKPQNLISPENLPGGGHTIVLENIAYSRNTLNKKYIELRYLFENGSVYIKLSDGIYIDRQGKLVNPSIIPKIMEYYN